MKAPAEFVARLAAATLAAGAVLTASPAAVPPARAHTQATADTTTMSDSTLREAPDRDRPPAEPPTDWVDVVTFPYDVVTYPLHLLAEGVEAGLVLAGRRGPPSPLVVAYRDLRAWGVSPGIGSVGPRSGPAAKIHVDRWAPLHARSAYARSGSQRHEAWLQLPRDSDRLVVRGWFRRWAQPRFWGLGPDAPASAAVDYRWDQWGGEAEARLVDRSWIRLGVSAGYEENQAGDGSDPQVPDITSRYDADRLFGLGETGEYLRAGGSLALDFTRRRMFQERGAELGVGARLFRGVTGTRADFHRFRLTGDGYLPLTPLQSLVLRGRLELNRSDGGRGVPFTHLAGLGDEVGARAYTDYRFRGNDLAAATAEYRWEIWRDPRETVRLGGFLFFEEGVVARNLSGISSGDWRPSYGFGMRVETRSGPLGSWFVANGDEGARVQVSVEVEP